MSSVPILPREDLHLPECELASRRIWIQEQLLRSIAAETYEDALRLGHRLMRFDLQSYGCVRRCRALFRPPAPNLLQPFCDCIGTSFNTLHGQAVVSRIP